MAIYDLCGPRNSIKRQINYYIYMIKKFGRAGSINLVGAQCDAICTSKVHFYNLLASSIQYRIKYYTTASCPPT